MLSTQEYKDSVNAHINDTYQAVTYIPMYLSKIDMAIRDTETRGREIAARKQYLMSILDQKRKAEKSIFDIGTLTVAQISEINRLGKNG